MPFTLIPGEVSPHPVSWATSDERTAALGRWVSIIAREVARRFAPGPERLGVKTFVHSHRLTIASAFERRLVRRDVVAELTRLYQLNRADPANSEPAID